MQTAKAREWRGDVLVVGAGPAGLSAADELAKGGLEVLLVDENQRPGGQIWRQRFMSQAPDDGDVAHGDGYHDEDVASQRVDVDNASAHDRIGISLRPHITFLGQAVCHGVLDGGGAVLSTPAGTVSVRARAVIIATGGLERVLPVPGWTTLGVMTAGAAQTFLKGSGFFPYRRVVVAGTGPLLLAAASQLVTAGVEVVAVVEAAHLRSSRARDAARLLRAPRVLAEGIKYIRTLHKAKVPLRIGTGVFRVEGSDRVTGVWLKKLHRDWSFSATESTFVACDAVLLSHGFTSSFEIAAQLDAQIEWDNRRQTWKPQRDEDFFTSAKHVQAVGDCAGVGGVHVATLEGAIAGIVLAARLTPMDGYEARLRRLRRRLARLETFRLGMDNLFRPGSGTATWPTPDTCICRCQETPMSEVEAALSNDISDLHGLKLWTRAGMGACQGRVCTPVLAAILASRGHDVGALKSPTARFPVRPIPVHTFEELPAHHTTSIED